MSHAVILTYISNLFWGCLWMKDKYIEELVKYDELNIEEETSDSDTNHDEKHHEI